MKEILQKVLEELKNDREIHDDGHFLCILARQVLDKYDYNIFKDYLYSNVDNIILPDHDITFKEFKKENNTHHTAIWKGNEYEARLKWLTKHISLN